MNKILKFLAKPFPQEESILATLNLVLGISLFVVFFLFIFKPFGFHKIETGLFWLCLGFGAVAFLSSMAYEFIIVKVLKIKGDGTNFTFGKWIAYFVGAMLIISLANFVFVRLVLFDDIQWSLFPYMLRGTFAIGFFPVIVIGTIALLRQERKYQSIAQEVNLNASNPKSSRAQPRYPQTQGRVLFGIPLDRIRYIEAMQNYIKINHVNDLGTSEVLTERATLKSISETVQNCSISRCHRSFYVNREHINSISGNAQGLLISLINCDKQVPVSRSYLSQFRHGQYKL